MYFGYRGFYISMFIVGLRVFVDIITFVDFIGNAAIALFVFVVTFSWSYLVVEFDEVANRFSRYF